MLKLHRLLCNLNVMVDSKGSLVISLGLASVFILLIISLGIYFFNGYNSDEKHLDSMPTPSETAVPSAMPSASTYKDPHEQVIVTIPEGWKKIVNEGGYPHILISSPDYQQIPSNNRPGLVMIISLQETGTIPSIEDRYQELYKEIHDPNPGGAVSENLKRITIAEYDGLTYDFDFEGIRTYYQLWHNNSIWLITVHSSTIKTHTQYEKEINAILESIRLP